MRNLKNGTKLFTEKELTKFGEYLLSEERTNRIKDNYHPNDNWTLEERLQQVYHADFQNFLTKILKDKK